MNGTRHCRSCSPRAIFRVGEIIFKSHVCTQTGRVLHIQSSFTHVPELKRSHGDCGERCILLAKQMHTSLQYFFKSLRLIFDS